MANPICHFEIGVRDKDKSGKFYSQLFDWKTELAPDGSGALMLRTGTDISGHLNALGHEPHNYTIFYIMVDDIAATVAKAEQLGGKKLVGPLPVGPDGQFAWIRDPEGNVVGVYHQKSKPEGKS